MENFFSRYKNPMVLMAVILIQVVALATQVKRPDSAHAAGSSTSLIRVWTLTAITPFERALVSTGHFFRNTWHNYIDLHGVRKQNRELQDELARLRLEQVRLRASADESERLRALLDFKERYVGQTVAAEVIGTSGTDLARVIQIDKGSRAGVKQDMAVITPDGIVGKVKEVSPLSSQVLMINDRESGAGVVLENTRLHGILRGLGQGELQVSDIMSDEKVEVGESVVTSGGDGVYPKGLPVGTVTKVASDTEGTPFLFIKVKPAANLDRLEEVLVVVKVAEAAPEVAGDSAPRRAADVLAERLPSVSKPSDSTAGNKTSTNVPANASSAPGSAGVTGSKPATPAVTPNLKPSKTPKVPKLTAGDAAAATAKGGTAAPVRKPKAPAKPSPSPSPDDAAATDNTPPAPKNEQAPAPSPEKPPR